MVPDSSMAEVCFEGGDEEDGCDRARAGITSYLACVGSVAQDCRARVGGALNAVRRWRYSVVVAEGFSMGVRLGQRWEARARCGGWRRCSADRCTLDLAEVL